MEDHQHGSILETIGNELIGVITPVSICMLLVVLLISTLSPSSTSPSSQPTPQLITAANLVYSESPSDTPSHKFIGALENAAVFILLIAAVTFLLVLLYYFKFTSFLTYYMRFSTFVILFSMGGPILISLITHFGVKVDALSFGLGLFNFAVVGVFAVLGGGGVPIIVTQGYTVVLGIVTAAWFTQLPEWTTWILLVALALYDLVAVLAPGGPLKLLVELAQSRDDDLPALVYEARPTVRVSRPRRGGGGEGLEMGVVSDNVGSVVEMQNLSRYVDIDGERGGEISEVGSDVEGGNLREIRAEGEEERGQVVEGNVRGGGEEERAPLVEGNGRGSREEEEEDEEGMARGIKLGLGDFVFYSVLVGRAAMYDLMTVYACYLAIISGLACTLILLSVARRALPALPISIALGVLFYFLTRLLMEPFVVGTATNLLMF